MNDELRIMNRERRKNSGFFHTSYFLLHTSSAKRGQALVLVAIFFTAISVTVGLGVVGPVLHQVESVRSVETGAQSLYAADAVSQDVSYRLIKGMSVDGVETLSIGAATAIATTTTVLNDKEIVSAGSKDRFVRKNKVVLGAGSGTAFNYGVQTGEGGIHLQNSAIVIGNVFSNGPITGENSNLIKGDVISAGSSGLIRGVHATSSAYAHTIEDSTIDRDVHYQMILNTTVGGTSYPGSSDQATSTLPIGDAQIESWKSDAAVGGIVTCSGGVYNVSGSVTLGPKKIPCNLKIDGSDQVTLLGNLWVEGNIEIVNTGAVRIDPSLAEKSVIIVPDKPANRITSSKINLKNRTTFSGSGHPNSYVLLISQNQSAEVGGSELAIEVQNNAMGKLLVYAGHGEINLKNDINLKEVTGYKITIQNNAQVVYESGLANLLFSSGPSGGYFVDSWKEVE